MKKLIDLPSPTLSLSSLRIFYDKIETSIRGLESLGQSQDTYGSLLTPIIFRKLPSELRKTLTREHGSYSWDINALRLAIGKELQVQEAGQSDLSDNCAPTALFVTKATQKPNNRNANNGYHFKKTAGNSSVKLCVFCDQLHLSMEFTKVVDREARFAIVKKNSYALIVLVSTKLQIAALALNAVNVTKSTIPVCVIRTNPLNKPNQ